MKTFDYVVKDELGIHARPAGLLVKEVKNYKEQEAGVGPCETHLGLLTGIS